jgi:hypothetical protein
MASNDPKAPEKPMDQVADIFNTFVPGAPLADE